jgi:hypothetical protein
MIVASPCVLSESPRFTQEPNKLLITTQHDSVSRYLGPAREGYPGQHGPAFRVLLAELIADNVRASLVEDIYTRGMGRVHEGIDFAAGIKPSVARLCGGSAEDPDRESAREPRGGVCS